MDLHDALRPLYALSKWVGFTPYNLKKCGKKREKASLYMNNVALAVVLFINLFAAYYNIPNLRSISSLAVAFVIFVTSINSSGTVIFARLYRKRFIACIQKLVNLGHDVDHLTQTVKSYKRMKRNLIFSIMVCHILIVVMAILDIIVSMHKRRVLWQCCMTILYYTAIILAANSILWIHILLQELNERFKQVNNFISSSTVGDSARYIHTKTRLIKKVYRQIQDISMEINYMFRNHILGQICTTFISLVYLLYKLTKYRIFVHHNYIIYNYVSSTMIVCMQLVSITFIVHYFDSLSKESKKTVRLMEEIEKAVGRNNLPYKQVELFSLQVYVDSCKFSVYSYFPLDWTLFNWMLSGIATYLVIFHQFGSMERKHKRHD